MELPAIGTHAVSLFTRVPEFRRGPRGGALLRPHQTWGVEGPRQSTATVPLSLQRRLDARTPPPLPGPGVTRQQWFGAASLHAEIDVWTVGAPEEFRGHGGTGGVGGQRGRRRVQSERATRTEPCHHPAPRQTEGQRQHHHGQGRAASRAARPARPARPAVPPPSAPRPLQRPRPLCRCGAPSPLASGHPSSRPRTPAATVRSVH